MSRSFRHGKRQKQKYYKWEYNWWKREPKEHRRLYKHKKRRAAVRRCRYLVLTGSVDILWPLDSKPWEYYW